MPDRRRMLSGVVALVLGSPLSGVGTATAGRPSDDGHSTAGDQTELTVAGDPGVLRLSGVPDTAAPFLRAVRQEYPSVSPRGLDHVAGTVVTRGTAVRGGSGTAWGSFDARSITEELESKAAFSRVDRSGESDAGGAERPSGTETGGDPQRSGESPQVFVRSAPATAVAVGQTRIDIAGGRDREDTTERLANRRGESDPATTENRASAHVTLGGATRRQLIDRVGDSADNVVSLLRGLRTAGVVVQAGAETTTVRYGISLREDHQAGGAVDELKRSLATHEATRLRGQRDTENGLAVEATVRTNAIWDVHEAVLGAD